MENKNYLLGKGQHVFCKRRSLDTHLLVFFGEISDLIDIVNILKKKYYLLQKVSLRM